MFSFPHADLELDKLTAQIGGVKFKKLPLHTMPQELRSSFLISLVITCTLMH